MAVGPQTPDDVVSLPPAVATPPTVAAPPSVLGTWAFVVAALSLFALALGLYFDIGLAVPCLLTSAATFVCWLTLKFYGVTPDQKLGSFSKKAHQRLLGGASIITFAAFCLFLFWSPTTTDLFRKPIDKQVIDVTPWFGGSAPHDLPTPKNAPGNAVDEHKTRQWKRWISDAISRQQKPTERLVFVQMDNFGDDYQTFNAELSVSATFKIESACAFLVRSPSGISGRPYERMQCINSTVDSTATPRSRCDLIVSSPDEDEHLEIFLVVSSVGSATFPTTANGLNIEMRVKK